MLTKSRLHFVKHQRFDFMYTSKISLYNIKVMSSNMYENYYFDRAFTLYANLYKFHMK